MGIFRSLKKSWKIRSISKTLGAPFDAYASNMLKDLVSEKSSKEDQAMESLFNLCESDPQLRQIMEVYGANRETLEDFYNMLIINGAGQWEQGHYVPVSALAFSFTLQFLLENSGKLSWRDICVLLLEYFERNEVGPVPLEMRGPADPNDPLNAMWEIEQKLKRDKKQ